MSPCCAATSSIIGKKQKCGPLPHLSAASLENSDEHALKKLLMIGTLIVGAAAVSGGALAAEFYVVRDAATTKCTIVDSKPATTTTTIVDGTFKTRTEAKTGIKTMNICTNN